MDYPYDPIVAIDRETGLRVINGTGAIYAITDTARTAPLQAYDLSGLPVTLQTNAEAFIPPFKVPDQWQVLFVSGTSEVPMTSYLGLKEEANASAQSAQASSASASASADSAATSAGNTVATAAVTGDDLILTRQDGETINAGNVRGPQGDQGDPGSNTVPTAEAIADEVSTEGRAAREAIDALIAAAVQAERARADGAYALVANKNFDGAPLYSYGHSWTALPSGYSTPNTGEYQVRLAKRLGLGAVASHGLSAAYMMDMASAIMAPTFSSKDRRLPAGSRGIVLLQCLINDLVSGSAVPAAAESVNFYKHMLRTFLAAASAGTFQDRDAGTFVGAWLDSSGGVAQWYPAGKLKQISSVGATASWTVSGDTAWVHCSASTAGLSSGAWTARVNGTVVGSFSPQGVLPAGLVSPVMGSRSDLPVAVKVTGMTAAAGTSGTKTLTITTNEAKATYLSGVSTPAANPPRIFVALEAPRNPAASGMAAWNTWEPIYRQAIIDVVAEFPNASTVDLAPGWINPDFIRSTDGQLAHANDLGMHHIASRFEAAIRSAISTPNPGVLAL